MRKIRFFTCLIIALLISGVDLLGQKYNGVIHQELSWSDLQYMPTNELRILKNEIVALRGLASHTQEASGPSNPFRSFDAFLSPMDQKNIQLIDQTIRNADNEKECNTQELFELFLANVEYKQAMPIYISNLFYDGYLNNQEVANQWSIQVSDQFYTIWIPTPDACKSCDATHHLYTFDLAGNSILRKKFLGKFIKDESGKYIIQEVTQKNSDPKSGIKQYTFDSFGSLLEL